MSILKNLFENIKSGGPKIIIIDYVKKGTAEIIKEIKEICNESTVAQNFQTITFHLFSNPNLLVGQVSMKDVSIGEIKSCQAFLLILQRVSIKAQM